MSIRVCFMAFSVVVAKTRLEILYDHATSSGHSDRAGKGMCPQVGENCVKDTKEEEMLHLM